MIGFLIYLLGWLIWSIGYYFYKVYIDKDIWTKKRLIIYRSFISGVWSWFGIIVFITILITYGICSIHELVEEKLK